MALEYNFFGNNYTTIEPIKEPYVSVPNLLGDSDVFPGAYRLTQDGIPIIERKQESTVSLPEYELEELIISQPPAVTQEINQEVKTELINDATIYKLNNTKLLSKNEWVNALSEAYRKLGVSENGIRNLIAKNALESNWGKSALGKYNYGNITTGSSWKGAYVNGHDHDGHGNPIRNKFRSYNSIEEFAKDEIDFLKRLYDFDDKDDIKTFVHKLLGGNKGKRHYAGSPTYKSAVIKVYGQLK